MTTITQVGDERDYLKEFRGTPLPTVNSVYPGTVKGYVRGLMTRTPDGAKASPAYVQSFVIEVYWNTSQLTAGGPIDPSVISSVLADLTWAADHGMNVRLRTFAGLYAPTWVKTACGQMTWYDYSASAGETLKGTIPVWWNSAMRDAYADWQTKLAGAFGSHPNLCDVTDARCMTIFAEPMNRQLGSPHDVAALRDHGYTVDLDLASIKESMIQHRDIWVPYGVATSFAFNPWQEPVDLAGGLGGGKSNLPVSLDLMDYMGTNLGRTGVLQNNSIGNPINTRGPRYQSFWEYMGSKAGQTYPFPQPIAFQTMNTNVMRTFHDKTNPNTGTPFGTDCFGTGALCADLGGIAVEMPAGFTTDSVVGITLAQADDLNSRLDANYALLGV